MSTPIPFYVVWEPYSGKTHVRHESRLLAEREAERLARLNPMKEFIVLSSVVLKTSVSKVKTFEYGKGKK